MVTAGNCDWCASASGAVVCSKCAKAESCTWPLAVTALGVAVVLVLVVPTAVLATVATTPFEVDRAGDIHARQRGGVLLEARLRLQDHAVLVGLPVNGGNLPLAEGVVERVGDALHGDAQAPGLLAVDLHIDARAAFLRLGGDLAQRRRAPQRLRELVRPGQHLVAVGRHQRVLILRARHARGNLDVLHALEIDRHAGDAGDLVLQPRDDRRRPDRGADRAA